MNNLSLRARTFLLAFIPMLLITVILSLYFIRVQLDDIDKTINDRGYFMVKYLADASEYGLFSGNKDYLKALLHSSVIEKDVISISVYEKTGDLFIQLQSTSTSATIPSTNGRNIRNFRYPITLHMTDISDIDDTTESNYKAGKDLEIGWLEISLSTSQLILKRNRAIVDASLIILIGLISSIILALWMGKSLTDPIIRLTNSVNRIEMGNLDEEIVTTSSGELGFLEKGVLSMLGKIRITQKDLQEKIDETTRGLKNSLSIVEKQNLELTEARLKAMESSQAKSRFIANISHELRTPMNGILGFTRLLMGSGLSNKQQDYVDTIEKSANNLLQLIEDILDISSVEAGKLKIINKNFDLHMCINEAITLLSPSINDKSLQISYHYYTDTPRMINAPYERIRQIFINLLGNAIKFSDKGQITIRVMLDPDEDKPDSIMISVTDEGIGIPEREIDKLFKPFSQIDDTSTRMHGGTGLGLAISKSIVKAMGGEIGIESKPGKGTNAWFTFRHHEQEAIEQLPTSINLPLEHNLADSKILIAEDNPINAKLLASILSDSGAWIHEVANGKEAVTEFKSGNYDLILMDIQMPVMNGLDAVSIIRNNSEYGNKIPIIGITAHAMQNDIDFYIQEGFNEVLIKPIVAEELIKTLIYWLHKSKHNNQIDNSALVNADMALNNNAAKSATTNKLGIKNELSTELLDMLINELPEVSLQIQDSFLSKNWELLRQQLHKLLGGISYCNVPGLQEITIKFQESVKTQSNTMESDFRNLIKEIKSLTSNESTAS